MQEVTLIRGDGIGPENAAAAVFAKGKHVTCDMNPHRDDPTAVGTSEMADAIIAKM